MKRSELKQLIREVIQETAETNEIFGFGKPDADVVHNNFLKRVRQEVPTWRQIARDAGEDELNELLIAAFNIAKKM